MKPFLNLQAPQWKKIYSLYLQHLTETDASSPDIAAATYISDYLIHDLNFDSEAAAFITSTLIKTFESIPSDTFAETSSSSSPQDEAQLSLQDISILKATLSEHHETSPEIVRLLLSYLVYARANPHPSF